MVTKTVYREVAVEVDVDLEDYDTDELIEEIEYRDGGNKWEVIDKNNTEFVAPRVYDEIFSFYQDYILWKDLGMKNETFERIANKFFEDHLDILVH